MLLPEGRVDLEMRRPELLLGFVGREIFEAGDRQRLARRAVPGWCEPSHQEKEVNMRSYSCSTAASSVHAAPPSTRL